MLNLMTDTVVVLAKGHYCQYLVIFIVALHLCAMTLIATRDHDNFAFYLFAFADWHQRRNKLLCCHVCVYCRATKLHKCLCQLYMYRRVSWWRRTHMFIKSKKQRDKPQNMQVFRNKMIKVFGQGWSSVTRDWADWRYFTAVQVR